MGQIVKIEKGGLLLELKGAGERTWSVELDPGVRIMRAISLAGISSGDFLHGILSDTSGDGLIRRGLVNAPGTHANAGKAAAHPSHIAGTVVSVDYKKRLVTLENGGKKETVGVADRVRLNAFVGADSLKLGDSVILLAQGPSSAAPVKTVIVRTPDLDRR